MPRLTYKDQQFHVLPQESVLDAFLRQGISIPFSCRGGVCQVCLQRCTEGDVAAAAKKGLSHELSDQGYFMACSCVPTGDMRIEPPLAEHFYIQTMVADKSMLNRDVCRLLLEPARTLDYKAGQFVNLRGSNGLVRSYSLASLPDEDYFLEIHVKRMKNGAMSNWILDELQVGDAVEIQGPDGECTYRPGHASDPMLMVCTGTGLAPLLGIVRDALHHEHAGRIYLYHGSSHLGGLYLQDTLKELAARYANFHYLPCVSGKDGRINDCLAGRAHDLAIANHPDLRGWRIYLAGMPEMVEATERIALSNGASPDMIQSDPFLLTELRKKPRSAPEAKSFDDSASSSGSPATSKPKDPPPDPELWQALRQGALLREILEDFYTRVYADDKLASFFRNATKQRLIEKQYSFMNQVITGDKVYFGDRPRNAHHWMVISDELFDYRATLMVTCMRDHSLPEPMVQRWHAIEEHYREEMVKSTPWPKIVHGIELPLDGFEELTIDSGTLCDGCGREIHPGDQVRYHLRLGTTYCSGCNGG